VESGYGDEWKTLYEGSVEDFDAAAVEAADV
jgi:hypothetical protein